eukprot:TRINITY_DN54061_c0_g1_i1.p1 TRINITY_DN54061_c0_g1~~TRINITY_DN54061_c0_g1_i1.p1  ORF type:complete len:644 (+),score=37.64 TRINITY_DN54061_c0_g1_i1:66-1997(+)
MGSKPVRERHHQLYGSTIGSLERTDQFSNPHGDLSREMFKQRQDQSMKRLSEPKKRKEKPARQRIGPSIGVDHKADGATHMGTLFGNDITWLYDKIKLTKEEVNMQPTRGSPTHTVMASAAYRKAIRIIDRLMKANGIEPTDGLKKREIEKIQGTYGLLFDIITTRRVILSGEPHKVGTELYRYIWSKYHTVKFAFIGITDNGSKRVARDVFCKDQLPNTTEEVYAKYITKSKFDVLDDDHMYIVFPENDGFIDEIIDVGIEQQEIEKEARDQRYLTQKFVRPEEPDFVKRAKERQKRVSPPTSPTSRCDVCSPIGILNNVTLSTPGEWTTPTSPTSTVRQQQAQSMGKRWPNHHHHNRSHFSNTFSTTRTSSGIQTPLKFNATTSTVRSPSPVSRETSFNATGGSASPVVPQDAVTSRPTPWVKDKRRHASPTYSSLLNKKAPTDPSSVTITTLQEEFAAASSNYQSDPSSRAGSMSGTLQPLPSRPAASTVNTSSRQQVGKPLRSGPVRRTTPSLGKRTPPPRPSSTASPMSVTPGPSGKSTRPTSGLFAKDDFDPQELLKLAEQRINEMNQDFKRRARKGAEGNIGASKTSQVATKDKAAANPVHVHHQHVFNILMDHLEKQTNATKYTSLKFPNAAGST